MGEGHAKRGGGARGGCLPSAFAPASSCHRTSPRDPRMNRSVKPLEGARTGSLWACQWVQAAFAASQCGGA